VLSNRFVADLFFGLMHESTALFMVGRRLAISGIEIEKAEHQHLRVSQEFFGAPATVSPDGSG
jgi:hypothetical protein